MQGRRIAPRFVRHDAVHAAAGSPGAPSAPLALISPQMGGGPGAWRVLVGVVAVVALFVAATIPPVACAADVVPTRLLVRVMAHDAKLMGSKVGGASVTVRDVETGAVLAKGVQLGGTGDTRALVVEAHGRRDNPYDTEGAARYEVILPLSRPTMVEVVAEGPLGHPQAMQRASKTLLMVPGRDVTGPGLVLELHGFTVEFLEPTDEGPFAVGQALRVRARITML